MKSITVPSADRSSFVYVTKYQPWSGACIIEQRPIPNSNMVPKNVVNGTSFGAKPSTNTSLVNQFIPPDTQRTFGARFTNAKMKVDHILSDSNELQELKDRLIDVLSPLVRELSPKWGEQIIEELTKCESSELLELSKSEEKLRSKVREEEIRLERIRD